MFLSHLRQANTRENKVASGPRGRADFSFTSPEPMANRGGNTQDPSQFKNPWNENNPTQQPHTSLLTQLFGT